ncbi:acetyltransferase [Gottschalkia purinilytica]|uniref:Acetyltransferase n=1 Tax=Gottschalkia purinilytica TaxID=1503 RepID=A0A0L0W7Z0_GOTPU|nr:GNAT family N-acetyltransferase [Gottschalkia purinilytica]KNF07556.1 acetyltransferase [Gottschalkia purinilytica]
MNYIVRRATEQDIKSISKLFRKLGIDQMSKDQYFNEDLNNIEVSEEEISSSLNDPRCIIYVAEADKEIIGYIEGWLRDKDFYFFIDDYAYILHIYVDEEYRSYGVLHSLHKCVEDWAKENNLKYVQADVFEHNKKVQKIIEYLGYSTYRRRYVKDIFSPSKEEKL